jgi:hypothetical protein
VYAVAAVVALVSVFAWTQPSEAKIVYTHANVVLSCETNFCDQQYNLDLNHDGVTDFTITVKFIIFDLCRVLVRLASFPPRAMVQSVVFMRQH